VPEHAAKASYLLGLVPAKGDAQYLTAAQGASQAVAGNFAEARALLDAASRKDPQDPIQDDLKYVRGELELAAKDADAAIAAFAAAGQGTTPRAQYGLARAYLMKNDRAKAQAALDATVAASPEHVGALLARVRLVWNTKQDEASSLRDLKVVIDGAARANASPTELSRAFALRGWVYFAANRATDARAAFDEASKLDPRNASALIGQGELLYADGRYTDALARFDDALQRSPEDIDAICGSAKTKVKLERLQEAKTQLTAARSTYKSDMSVSLWLGKAEEALGNKSVAETEYNVAIELVDPQLQNGVEPYAALATLLASQGRGAEAFKKLDAAKAKLADTPALHRAFGDVLASQGKFDEAVAHYEKALSTKEDSAVRFRLGQTYRKMRKLDLATAEFSKVAAADKDYPGLALERGMLFEEAGEEQKALEQFQGALAKAPKDLDLMLRVGAAYVAIGQGDEAQKMLAKVYEQRPNSAEANHFLGRAYLRQGGLQVTAAMPRLRRAAELDPNRAEYHLYVAWAANEAAQPDIGLAEKEVDRALALDSTLADAYWQRGVVKFKLGAVKDAERDLRKALELKPNRIEAHAALAEVFETNNNDAGALAAWAVATNAMPKQAFWRYRYGKLLKAKGRGADAAVNLAFAVHEALALQPRPGWLYAAAFAAAETQRATGKKADAVENYKLYLQNAPTGDPDRADAAAALKQLGAAAPE
jgi:tetratricopeptide (TPR) repeat protein